MDDKTLCFPAGKAIAFTSGEYSDFGHCGAVVTLKHCDLFKLGEEFKATYKATAPYGGSFIHPSDFPSWLVANGHAFPAEIQEVHCGGGGGFDLE